jgi:hypothetical protein
MAKAVIILASAILLASCGAYKHMPVESQKDSVSVIIKEKVIYKDSLIYVEVPAESSSAIIPDTDTSRLETSLAMSEAWVADGTLNHTLRHKPDMRIPKIISIPSYARTEQIASLSEKVVVKEVEKDLNGWQRLRMTVGTIFLIGVIIRLIMWVTKRFI